MDKIWKLWMTNCDEFWSLFCSWIRDRLWYHVNNLEMSVVCSMLGELLPGHFLLLRADPDLRTLRYFSHLQGPVNVAQTKRIWKSTKLAKSRCMQSTLMTTIAISVVNDNQITLLSAHQSAIVWVFACRRRDAFADLEIKETSSDNRGLSLASTLHAQYWE